MDTTTTTPTATTAFGFDRMVQGMHNGNVGIRTGSTQRSGGKMHIANSSDKRTACGQIIDSSYSLIVPRHGMTGEQWAERLVTCTKCRRVMK